jgi:two-component system phosphate regulon sensor histidine kinase PhoR
VIVRRHWWSSTLPFIFALVIVVIALWLALSWQYHDLEQAVEDGITQQTLEEAQLSAALIEGGGDPTHWHIPGLPQTRRLTLINPDGHVIYDSLADTEKMENHNSRPEVIAARNHGSGHAKRISATTGISQIYAAVLLPDQRVVRVSAPFTVEASLVSNLFSSAAVAAVIVAAVAVGLVGWAAARDRMRFRALQDVSRAFARGEFRSRVHLPGGGTVGLLGQELNLLGERLQATLDELDSSRRLLDTALGSLQEGVGCIDRLDRLVYANAAYRQIAAGGADVVGQLFYEHLPADPISQPLALARTGEGTGSQAAEFEHRRRRIEAVVVPSGGEVVVVVLHDVTEVRLAEQSRRDFMSSVSHEFKTPLTAIQGFTETLLEGALEDAVVARDFASKIHRHAERLSTLVHDVLTLARLEQGGWKVRPEVVDLCQLAQEILDEYQPLAQNKRVTMQVVAPAALELVNDPELLRQLIGNLISNAIRYNKEGGSVTVHLAAADGQQVMVTVQDTGPGIPPEHRERIFERFYRIDAHRSRQTGGTGLGLAIVKQLLTILHGSIRLHSDASGSRFEMLLPRTSSQPQPPVDASQLASSPPRS